MILSERYQVEEIIELHKMVKDNPYNSMTYFIHICIEYIIKKIDENNNPFKDELNFKYELILELKKVFNEHNINNIYVHAEYNELNYYAALNLNIKTLKNFTVADIVIEFNNKYYIIELKYGLDRNGKIAPSISGSFWGNGKGFQEDCDKTQSLVNNLENVDCGYCIFLTLLNERIEYAKAHCCEDRFKNTIFDLNCAKKWKKWIDIKKYSYYIEEIK
jgi:hypothetical protein